MYNAQKMKFSIKENLLKKSLMENIIFVKYTLLMPCKLRKPILKNICERQLLKLKSFCRTLSYIYGGKFCLYTEQKIRLSLQNFWMQNLQGTKKCNFFVFSFQLLLNTQEIGLSEASIFQVTDLMPEHIHS